MSVRHCHLNFFRGRSDSDIGSSSCWRFFWASDDTFSRSQVCFTEKANQLFRYVCLESGLFKKHDTHSRGGEKCCNIELRIILKFLLARLWPLRRKGPIFMHFICWIVPSSLPCLFCPMCKDYTLNWRWQSGMAYYPLSEGLTLYMVSRYKLGRRGRRNQLLLGKWYISKGQLAV